MSGTNLDLTGFKLTLDDEFNSFTSSPDGSSGWQTSFYFGGRSLPSNGEQEFYSDSTVGVNPFSLQNGELTITAAPGTNPQGLAYNSGLITSEGNFAQTYGYFEIRAELPQGAGMWPAFWLLPADKSWPPEIDVLEAFGAPNANGEGGANQAHYNAITSNYASGGGGDWATVPGDIYTGYHTYGVDWEADFITWYVDGQKTGQVVTPTDMHKPMYMLANLAVGGSWAGSPTGETGEMKIDYIRAYSNDPTAQAVVQQTISSPDGANTTPVYETPTISSTTNSGSVTVRVAEDAWSGDAQFVVLVDGKQIGGVQTATAMHAAGQWQDITLTGDIAAGPHTVDVKFINDGWGGTVTTDRNLYVKSIDINGEYILGNAAINSAANGSAAVDPGAAVMMVNGTAEFKATGIPTIPPDTLVLHVSEDAWNGDAQFKVLVDGQQVGAIQTATASHALGQVQDIVLAGSLGTGPHSIDVQFLNDGWGGTATTDRNLYVQSIDINGQHILGSTAIDNATAGQASADPTAAVMRVNGTAEFSSTGSAAPIAPAPVATVPLVSSGTLHIRVAEDAWNGDAKFTVAVDGQQVGDVQTATASHAAGQWQDIALTGPFGAGPHTVDINFINDGWGGTSSLDRNLYVKAIDVNGETILGSAASDNAAYGSAAADPTAAVMMVNGTAEFKATGTNMSTTSTLVLHVSEDAWNGNAQFTVSVDGAQVGGIQTATTSHALGEVQDITLSGDFGLFGPEKIDLTFLNDGWGGTAATDRNLYVESIDVNGVNFAGNAAANTAANGNAAADSHAAVMDINGTVDFAIGHTTTPSDFWHVT